MAADTTVKDANGNSITRRMYDSNGPVARTLGSAADKIKSWGRSNQPELAGQDTAVFDVSGPVASFRAWDEKQRYGTPAPAAQPQATSAPTPAAAPLEPPIRKDLVGLKKLGPQDLSRMPDGTLPSKASAAAAPVVAITPKPAQYGFASSPGGITMLGNPANYDKGAMQRLSDKVRTGPEKEIITVDGQMMERSEWDAKNNRLDAAQKELKLNQKPDEIYKPLRDSMPRGTTPAELATLADKQFLANSKTRADALAAETTAATDASKIEQENVRGRFGLQTQALQNKGLSNAEKIRAAATAKSKELDPSVVGENNARAALLKKQADSTLSKEDQLTIAGQTARDKAIIEKRGAIMASSNWASMTPVQQADALAQISMDANTQTFVPGAAPTKRSRGFLGIGSKDATVGTPGRVIDKDVTLPKGYTETGETKNGKKVYLDPNGNKVVGD